jgi:hypothetical protein
MTSLIERQSNKSRNRFLSRFVPVVQSVEAASNRYARKITGGKNLIDPARPSPTPLTVAFYAGNPTKNGTKQGAKWG